MPSDLAKEDESLPCRAPSFHLVAVRFFAPSCEPNPRQSPKSAFAWKAAGLPPEHAGRYLGAAPHFIRRPAMPPVLDLEHRAVPLDRPEERQPPRGLSIAEAVALPL